MIWHLEHGLPEMVINKMNQGLFLPFCHFCSQKASSLKVPLCTFFTRLPVSPISFLPNSTMRYSCDGFTSLCRILSTDGVNEPGPKIYIKLSCDHTLHTSPEFLQHVEDSDVASVPSTLADYRKQIDDLSDDDL